MPEPRHPEIHTYAGKQAEVDWDGRLCIHVGECGRAQGELFVGGRDPWCQPDLASLGEVAEVVERCPTGALTVRRSDGVDAESAPAENTITVANNGPLYVRGNLSIDGAGEDMPGTRFRAALCRCGQSKNKPFCDNSHEASGFVDRGAIGDKGPGIAAQDSEPGSRALPLTIGRAPNGPLILNGAVTLIAASGRTAWQGDKAALCRCGASENKPFCDGSHKSVGFEAP